MKEKLLVVDDDENLRKQLKWAFSKEYEVFLAGTTQEAIEIARENLPDVVLLDLNLEENTSNEYEGVEILRNLLEMDPTIKVIMLTGIDEEEWAIKCIDIGAHDYYIKPVKITELKTILKRASFKRKLELESRKLREKEEVSFEEIVGNCEKMKEVFKLIEKVAKTDIPVLITGETGTGKELVARAIYKRSSRKNKPFVIINCGAIPDNLLESELFGYEKGSFTGAYKKKLGKIEIANGGVLFLDEIGELPPHLQVKLLRFLQESKIDRIGGKYPIKVNVRIIAATNRDLSRAVEEGKFREDLFFRLNVVNIHLPPLRERGDDIILLANHFLNFYNDKFGKRIKGFTNECIKSIMSYSWPGNVRELENRIKRALIVLNEGLIDSLSMGLDKETLNKKLTLKEAKEKLEKDLITLSLKKWKGNLKKAAEDLGITRQTLYSLMRKYNLQIEEDMKLNY